MKTTGKIVCLVLFLILVGIVVFQFYKNKNLKKELTETKQNYEELIVLKNAIHDFRVSVIIDTSNDTSSMDEDTDILDNMSEEEIKQWMNKLSVQITLVK